MDVRVVRVRVCQRLVPVNVRMGFVAAPVECVLVPVMFVVTVPV
jgi:hypothetical protein